MTISIDELLRLAALELAERERKKRDLVDPFKRKRTEPGRALRYHGGKPPKSASLGGKHS